MSSAATSSLSPANPITQNHSEAAASKPVPTEVVALEFFQSVQNEVQVSQYFNEKNIKEWGEFLAPYVFYGVILPSIKTAVQSSNDSLAKTLVLSGIKVLEWIPNFLRCANPMFDCSLIRNDKGAHQIINTAWGDIVCDSKGLPIINKDGTPMVLILPTKSSEFDLGLKFFSIFIPTAPYLIGEKAVRTFAIANAADDYCKGYFFYFYKWKVDQLKEITDKKRIPDKELDESVKNDKSLTCPLSGRVTVIPVNCPKGHLFEYYLIEQYLLAHHSCPVDKAELHSCDLKFNATVWIRIQKGKTEKAN